MRQENQEREVSWKPSEALQGGNCSSTMCTEDGPSDPAIREVSSDLDKSHFRGRMGENLTSEGSNENERRRG